MKPTATTVSDAWRNIRRDPLCVDSWTGLLNEYWRNGLTWQSVYIAKQIIRLDSAARPTINETVGLLDWDRANNGDVVLGHPFLNGAEAQIERFNHWLDKNPGDWLTWLYLARLCDFVQDTALCEHAFEHAGQTEYLEGESAHLLGYWRLKSGNLPAALSVLSLLVDVRPLRHGSMMLLGETLLKIGQTVAAETAFSRASHSENVNFLSLLAQTVYQQNYWQEAIAILKKAVAIKPEDTEVWLQLAKIQSQVYMLSDCAESLRHILKIEPQNHAALSLENTLVGQYGDAKGYLDQLLFQYDKNGHQNSSLVSSILMTSLYQDHLEPTEKAELHTKLSFASDISEISSEKRPLKRKNSGRPLRVGYVTGDLHRQHPVSIFMLPLLKEQKKSAMEVYVYHTGTMHDAYTQQAKSYVNRWLDSSLLDDMELYKQIVDDDVDILIDLAGHTAFNRLGVFKKRAAPIQGTFLGYPHSTGLSCMDFLIGDSIVSPPEQSALFKETVVRLAGPVFCWAPVDNYPLPLNRPASDPVVFGSFNNAMKLSPKTIALWAQVVLSVPGSKLLLKAPSFRDQGVCQRFREIFKGHGVDSNQLEFRGPSELSEMMQEYGSIDIALDPLPYNGGTTSLQALWMGVPLVTCTGGNFASRMGTSFLQALGKSDWIAKDDSAYIAIAKKLATNVHLLRNSRHELRQIMAESALCNISEYAIDFETVLASMCAR